MKPNHTRMAALSLVLASAGQPAWALVKGVVDANVATSPWAGVVSITPAGGGIFSGALIDPWHVLTAAHVVNSNRDTPSNITINVNQDGDRSSVISAMHIAVHPSYTTGNTAADSLPFWHDDLAVVTLSQPVPIGVPTYGLYTGTPGLNSTPPNVTLVAYGGYSDGVSATLLTGGNPAVKRVGQNRIDGLKPDDEGSGQYEVFIFDFDGPTSDTNRIGPNTPANLTLGDDAEVGFAGGDSGGPVFIHDNGAWKIAGIAAFNGTFGTGTGNSLQFGALGGGMLVAPYVDWIQSQTALAVPEPKVYLTMGTGLALLGLATVLRKTLPAQH